MKMDKYEELLNEIEILKLRVEQLKEDNSQLRAENQHCDSETCSETVTHAHSRASTKSNELKTAQATPALARSKGFAAAAVARSRAAMPKAMLWEKAW
jgi:regulator of replication initiation timing